MNEINSMETLTANLKGIFLHLPDKNWSNTKPSKDIMRKDNQKTISLMILDPKFQTKI